MFTRFFEDTFKIASVVYDDDCTHTKYEEDFFHEYFCKGGCGDVEGRG